MNTTLNFMHKSVTGEIVNYFQDDDFKLIQTYANYIQFIVTTIIIIGFQIYGSLLNIFIMFIVVGSAKWLHLYYR